ncbi:MAG: hypothetical protein IJJ71_05115 [Treponema sp.]|uniref:hypothetical protein n=1 Tax=Treponema sp. TaxID=166 RepID=UPI0025D079AE|nr:hypothetical protein [Treponema sp.]MBR0495536.1 hypothetical protein [Treponema sp.]
MDADELFFINGGSGASASVSHTSVGGVPVTIAGNYGTISFTSSGDNSNPTNSQVSISNNHGKVSIGVYSNTSSSGSSSGSGGK